MAKRCWRCGNLLSETLKYNTDEGIECCDYECKECGATYQLCYDSDTINDNLDGDNNGNEDCLVCGHKMHISSNFMKSEIEGYAYPDDDGDDAMAYVYHCPNCGSDLTICDTPENWKQKYAYWKDNCDN